MREIKFRFWNGKHMSEKDGWCEDIGINEAIKSCIEYSTIIMQYTGLNDKNKKNIYEGDIISGFMDRTVVVSWDNALAGFNCFDISTTEDYGAFSCQHTNDYKNWKVLGDIYQNPELLKKYRNTFIKKITKKNKHTYLTRLN